MYYTVIEPGKQTKTASDEIEPTEAACLEGIDVQALSYLTILINMWVNA
jgi:hypothetical protein